MLLIPFARLYLNDTHGFSGQYYNSVRLILERRKQGVRIRLLRFYINENPRRPIGNRASEKRSGLRISLSNIGEELIQEGVTRCHT